MANPLKKTPPAEAFGPSTEFEKRAFCHDQNFRNRWARQVSRWHYVEPETKDKPASIVIAQDSTADEVWTVFDGKPIEYRGWPRDRIEKLERRARWLLAHGMLTSAELGGHGA